MRFSELVSIEHREDEDWFTPVLIEDTPLNVDPFLVFDDGDLVFAGAHDDVIGFFTLCIGARQASGAGSRGVSAGYPHASPDRSGTVSTSWSPGAHARDCPVPIPYPDPAGGTPCPN